MAMIRRLIQEEDPKKPLGDQEICRRLGEMGFSVARRTVAKYREQMGLPIASRRRMV